MKTICLNMIVKNEIHVIQRCLSSVKHLIHSWVIVDTGSTDGTQQAIRDALSDLPGQLFERPWVNFGHNRNEALQLARSRADYILFIDADDRLVFADNFSLPDLTHDCYYIRQETRCRHAHQMNNQVVLLIKDHPDFQWVGALHEALACKEPKNCTVLQGVINEYYQDGGRSKDPEKHLKEASILEEALRQEPSNSRNVFYLAQTYVFARKFDLALAQYEKRAAMGGREDEIFWSLHSIAVIQRMLKMEGERVEKSCLRAHQYCPTRMEPLYELADLYREMGREEECLTVAEQTLALPLKKEGLFVEAWKYDWGMQLLALRAAHRLGKETKEKARKLLEVAALPRESREWVRERAEG